MTITSLIPYTPPSLKVAPLGFRSRICAGSGSDFTSGSYTRDDAEYNYGGLD